MTYRARSFFVAAGSLAALLHAHALLAPSVVRAQEISCPLDHVGCHLADVDFHHRDALFDDVSLDSGWVPAGSPLQVRFGVFLGGSTDVNLGGTVVTSWPGALDVAVPGRADTGRLAVNYGIEILARMRFDVTVAGIHYRWEGDVPLPSGIPRDLRVADELVFDPFVLPGSDPRPVLVWDDTEVVTLFEVDITDAFIPIPGIGGGFMVDAVAELEGSYQTERIDVSDAVAPIVVEGASTIVRAAPGEPELGAAKDMTILPHGTVGYDGVVTLFPRLFIEVAGRRFDLTLTEIPLRVVDQNAETEFEPASVHVPLPDIRLSESAMDLGEVLVGATEERLVTIHNDGEAALSVSASNPGAPFDLDTARMTIPPSSSARLAVRFTPLADGATSGVVLFASNDPDEPLVTLRLAGAGFGDTPDDAAVPLDGGVGLDGGDAGGGYAVDGGCGCRVGAARPVSAPGVLALLALALFVRARRRRA